MGWSPDKAYAKAIGARIAQARKERGMLQEDLARELRVTVRSVGAYESGEVVPYRRMRDLERILGRSDVWFLHGDEAAPDIDPGVIPDKTPEPAEPEPIEQRQPFERLTSYANDHDDADAVAWLTGLLALADQAVETWQSEMTETMSDLADYLPPE
ncbi:MAG TPA: helix-turn-helix transcriptional regulator [Gaiellaceae bacterium]|jgi:transcriptional regulator with XRE-family HTH domain|nr:helix-turn-helix transcriptional regulator [Gaiellaceae bacterium]